MSFGSPVPRGCNVRDGWGAQGASTITQQLARQSFLTPEKTLLRKLTEVAAAVRIERTFSKDEILQLYLNRTYFGAGLYGAEAASLGYFGKHAADLDVAEAALLAGLVKSPSTNAPTVNLARAVSRRNAVLRAMRETPPSTTPTYDAAVHSTPTLVDSLRRDEAYGQYFKEEVRKQLVRQFGWERVSEGGLRVYTTFDFEMQKAAEAEVHARASPRSKVARHVFARHRRRFAILCRPRSSHSTRARAKFARWWVGATSGEPIRPRDAGPAPAGLGVQAVRLCRRARSGVHAGQHHRPPRRCRS